ncbi:glycosyltransferase family 4 protein [Cobetia sp. 10Alg 146]|uniref:glycosyltransferase family 4 protein n=1 Tax=Cobetia sp. 10Alg 146 TaxID=3040019 RepID=UPI00244A2BEF|nr:glycosyltransferase family 4 protein [Cobetia sp. 10Alg 146]MDH2292315.1 glycosyltransferase family 4 protein [Cobetia sp. 10Alg 146]
MSNKKVNVAFVANSAWYLNNFRYNTLERFSATYNVTCITAPGTLNINNIHHVSIPLTASSTRLINEIHTLVKLIYTLYRSKSTIVFSFNPKTNLYASIACVLLRKKIITNISGVGDASKINGFKGVLYKFAVKFFYKKVDYNFFQNSSDMQKFESKDYIHKAKAELIPGSGVDLDKFTYNESFSSCRRFIMAARLLYTKGVIEYLESSKHLSYIYKNSCYSLAGVPDSSPRGVPSEEITPFSHIPNINILGMRNDMPEVLEKVDCVVLPSYYPEGTPRSLLEAAAAGKIIITTDTPGCRDVVIEGVNGFLVPPRDTEALKEAMEKVINLSDEKLAEMQANSRKLAEEKFDEQYVIQRYLDVAEEILAKKSKK